MSAFWVVIWSKPWRWSKLERLPSLIHMPIIVSSKSFFFFFIQLNKYQGHHFESRLKEKVPITPFAAFIVILAMVFTVILRWFEREAIYRNPGNKLYDILSYLIEMHKEREGVWGETQRNISIVRLPGSVKGCPSFWKRSNRLWTLRMAK
jgi:hypothetical protein